MSLDENETKRPNDIMYSENIREYLCG